MQVDFDQLDRIISIFDYEFPRLRSDIDKLIKRKGLPGFVSYFKKLKAWALQILSGNANYSDRWFITKAYRGSRIPVRFRYIFRPYIRAIERSDEHRVRFYLSIFNIYHVVYGPEDSDINQQINVAISEVPSYSYDQGYYFSLINLMSKGIIKKPKPRNTRLATGQTVAIRPGVNGSFVDYISDLAPRSSLGEKVSPREAERCKSQLPFQGNFLAFGESGGKTRLVVVGSPPLQAALFYIKEYLLDILRAIPTDCTFRQNEGVEFLSKKLTSGSIVHSVDLKDATWNFPSSLQKKLCYNIGIPIEDIKRIFDGFVFSRYKPEGLFQIHKGQSMGLGPSFPLFSLCHNMILAGLCHYAKVKPVDTFRVLGDDVIIANDVVHEEYMKFLKVFHIPISTSKSFSSKRIGEFAGKVIWDGFDVTPIKWRQLDFHNLSNLYWPYRKVRKGLPELMLKNFRAKQAYVVLGPLSRSLGGLGLKERVLPRVMSGSKVDRLRTGYLHSVEDGLLNKDSGGGKIRLKLKKKVNRYENAKYSEYKYKPYFLSREKQQLLEEELTCSYTTAYGVLPLLTPNPGKLFSQLKEKNELMPERRRLRRDGTIQQVLRIIYGSRKYARIHRIQETDNSVIESYEKHLMVETPRVVYYRGWKTKQILVLNLQMEVNHVKKTCSSAPEVEDRIIPKFFKG